MACQRLPFHRSADGPEFDIPVAMQKEADVHEIPAAGFGAGTMRQWVPFQRSMRAAPELEFPAAKHSEEVGHETPPKLPPPGGSGAAWSDHLVPFQRSASVKKLPPLWRTYPPTAVHARDELQKTAENPFMNWAPAGLGVRSMRQRLPFQRSASVTGFPARLVAAPTAWQLAGVGQATPNNPPGWPAGGVGMMLHRAPFQRSAKNVPLSLGFEVPPTAMQAAEDVQVIANSPLALAPWRAGVRWIVQLVPFQRSASVTGVLRLFSEGPTAVQSEREVQSTALSPL
jgi:hypothetical protein